MENLLQYKILLVDDKPENLFSLAAVLKNAGYTSDSALSGKAALELLLKNKYGLMILDVQMPEMNGLEATEYIRDREKISQLPPIAIVAITANASHDDQLDLLQIKFEQPLDSIHSCTKQQLNYNVIHNDDDDCDIVQLEF